MRPRHVLTLAFVLILIAMGVWSFYGNVLNPHASGIPMEGMAMPEESAGALSGGAVTTVPAESTGGTSSAAPADEDVLPPTLGGWELTSLAAGEEARLQVEQLHGKSLGAGLEAAWVAAYGSASGSGSGGATVWISRAARADDARELFERMTARISEGTSPFKNLRPIGVEDVEGYALDGMGQTHYYFLVGSDLYWLGVDPAAAEVALAELLASAGD